MTVTTTKAFTVENFCEAYQISKSFLYKLAREGKGPRMMRVGRRTLISAEAAAEWQTRNEEKGAI